MTEEVLSLPIINTTTNPTTITISLGDYQLIINNALAYTMRIGCAKEFKLLNEAQAKDLLGCDSLTLATLRAQRKIVAVGEGKKSMYLQSSVELYLKHFKEALNEL